jgi:hypothetical protein
MYNPGNATYEALAAKIEPLLPSKPTLPKTPAKNKAPRA